MSTLLSFKDGITARKPHRCCLCGDQINKGAIQDVRTGTCDGSVWTMHMHPECHAYEQKPGIVDPDWYEEISEPAFDRTQALENHSETKL